MTTDRLAALLREHVLTQPQQALADEYAARLAAAGVTVAPDQRLAPAAELIRDLSVAYHQTGLVRDHHDPTDKTGWNVKGIETCGDPLCEDSLTWLAGVTVAPQPAPDALTETLSEIGLADVQYRMREPFTYHKSWPDGKRWTVCDGSGFDDDVVEIFDTEAEAAAAVKVANLVRENSLLVFATLAQPAPDALRVAAQAVVDAPWGEGLGWVNVTAADACIDAVAALRAALGDKP